MPVLIDSPIARVWLSRCGRYRVMQDRETFFAERRGKHGWQRISIHDRLGDAYAACLRALNAARPQ